MTIRHSATLVLLCGCSSDPEPAIEVRDTITLNLTFTSSSDQDQVTATFDDPDGNGGVPARTDQIHLAVGQRYALEVGMLKKFEHPPLDLDDLVRMNGDRYQLFFAGDGVVGSATGNPVAPLRHEYADSDINQLPIGLQNMFDTEAGRGTLFFVLQAMEIGGASVKAPNLAEAYRDGGLAALPGETLLFVNFPVVVE